MAEQYNGIERRQCSLHSEEHLRSCINADNIDKIEKKCDENLSSVYRDINRKTPLWTFVPLVLVLISILGVQWATYEKMTTWEAALEKRLTVLEERQTTIRDQLKGR